MKRFLLSMAIIVILCLPTFSQVPTIMMYQVQVKHGNSVAQDVTIEMQLRNSQAGPAVWRQTFNLTNIKNGSVQNLGLDFGKQINLSEGEYWLATILDGKEMGCAKLSSVPYALVAKEIEGTINTTYLIGKWKSINTREEDLCSIEFKENGTYTCENYIENAKGTYQILANGVLYTTSLDSKRDKILCDQIVKIDNNQMMMITDGGRFGKMILYYRE